MVISHDDVVKWKHFPRHWPFVRGIHRWPVNSPHIGQGRGALVYSLICVGTNAWVNNGDAADLRRHRAHYDVIVMSKENAWIAEGEASLEVLTAQPVSNWQKLGRSGALTPDALAPAICSSNIKSIFFKLISTINHKYILHSSESTFWWMPKDLTDDFSTLVQIMAWCHQATSTWANVDTYLCRHVAAWGHDMLTRIDLLMLP